MDGAVTPDWPRPTVDQAVRRHAAERPDEVAVVGPAASLTWAQLDAAADRAAAVIAATGGAGSRVAWLGANDIGYPATLLGAWRQRSALVGLNWRLPDRDLAACCAETAVTHIFTSTAFAGRAEAIAGPGVHIEVVDQTTAGMWPGRAAAAPLEPAADDVAMVFFTSGSTGPPKAVPLERLAMEIGATTPVVHGFQPDSRLLIVPPVFHLAGAYWVQYGLLYGSRQVYLADAAPKSIVAAMAGQRITHAVLVPTLIRALIDQLKIEPTPLPELRHVAYGASPIPPPTLREALEVLGCEMCQVYGMTEAGGVVTYLPPEDHRTDGAHTGRLASAGRPTVGVELQVRDLVTGQVVPPGTSGELWFRTPFMAKGYLGRPAETAKVFVDGWLNSRDVGHLDADGYVYVEGRSDEMIITGGENVHPLEVESALCELPDVAEAAVVGLPDRTWGQRVCAAIVRREDRLTEEAVLAHCRAELAGYKVPRTVVFLDGLPKTASGKISRSALVDLLSRQEPR
ncbi:class I adenylate-forming enzyme family protein [Thermomonospora curvata]|uniref:AMP-dependent synthetase and ligase n=1 Tax=Thermomonospora curvata (strain ATCC 19995 / DSM 43183 / JCM 3096 / KCTC 9072 / NBRC 15933 / NCIMB 10081 / Henssen B9) TaxID=471852 RepID=D1A7F6_THECD|nr:AMP-binding protein [Thermomonospora curvata]ACY96545.1 AMP-dependent synthetase and ligase [Thermomonospora curvata DSM 43183]